MKSGAGLCFSKMDTKNVKELLEMACQFDKTLQSWCQPHSILILLYLHFYIFLRRSCNSSWHTEKSYDIKTCNILMLVRECSYAMECVSSVVVLRRFLTLLPLPHSVLEIDFIWSSFSFLHSREKKVPCSYRGSHPCRWDACISFHMQARWNIWRSFPVKGPVLRRDCFFLWFRWVFLL